MCSGIRRNENEAPRADRRHRFSAADLEVTFEDKGGLRLTAMEMGHAVRPAVAAYDDGTSSHTSIVSFHKTRDVTVHPPLVRLDDQQVIARSLRWLRCTKRRRIRVCEQPVLDGHLGPMGPGADRPICRHNDPDRTAPNGTSMLASSEASQVHDKTALRLGTVEARPNTRASGGNRRRCNKERPAPHRCRRSLRTTWLRKGRTAACRASTSRTDGACRPPLAALYVLICSRDSVAGLARSVG